MNGRIKFMVRKKLKILNKQPSVLQVETGWLPADATAVKTTTETLDYGVYKRFPPWLRKIESILRLDFYMAWRVKQIEKHFDIIFAGSEKVGIPLSFMQLQKPLVVVAHHLESPMKAQLARATGIARKWAGVGYLSNESKKFFINDLGVAAERLFQYESAKYLDKVTPGSITPDGPIMSLGVAKRDYNTLIMALADLPDYETDLFVSSKFGDTLRDDIRVPKPPWVRLNEFMSEPELLARYRQAQFVVVPLEETTHNGAGVNVILEAGAFGKAVIATRTGGMPTFVKDGETGFLVPPNDVKAMREAIHTLHSRPYLAYQMGLAGRRYVEQCFDPHDVDARIEELLGTIYRNGTPQS